jgi:hypothetical protein
MYLEVLQICAVLQIEHLKNKIASPLIGIKQYCFTRTRNFRERGWAENAFFLGLLFPSTKYYWTFFGRKCEEHNLPIKNYLN